MKKEELDSTNDHLLYMLKLIKYWARHNPKMVDRICDKATLLLNKEENNVRK